MKRSILIEMKISKVNILPKISKRDERQLNPKNETNHPITLEKLKHFVTLF